jgi:hypothetical protein
MIMLIPSCQIDYLISVQVLNKKAELRLCTRIPAIFYFTF